jgi:peroxiredoxin
MALVEPPAAELGMHAPDFSLPGIDGAMHSLASCRGPSGLLLMFICNHCPFTRAILARLVEDMRELHALGIGVVAINPNDPLQLPDDDLSHMRSQAQEWHFCFPYLQDDQQRLAQACRAICTPDFLGFDRDLRLAYRGRLDGGLAGPRWPGMHRELVEAMGEIAERGYTEQPQQPTLGCSIRWRHGRAA